MKKRQRRAYRWREEPCLKIHTTKTRQCAADRCLLVPHDARWPAQAAEESARIRSALGDEVIEIHHIGSTAIPAIKAKPILDLLLVARSLSALDEKTRFLEELGYVARGEHGIPRRRYFVKNINDVRSHHLHAFELGDPQIERHLLFRDYLRAHPQVAEEYEQLKERLASLFPFDSVRYTEGKTEFGLKRTPGGGEPRRIADAAGYWREVPRGKHRARHLIFLAALVTSSRFAPARRPGCGSGCAAR